MWPGAARGNHPNSVYARLGLRGDATSAGHLPPGTAALRREGGARAQGAARRGSAPLNLEVDRGSRRPLPIDSIRFAPTDGMRAFGIRATRW